MAYSLLLLWCLLALVAFLYASVGHGGASGYLAIMALAGVAPSLMKPSALVMNLAVSLISFMGFYRAGHFKLKLFLPFAISSIPMAYWGGTMTLPDALYKKILAVCLLCSVFRMMYQFKEDTPASTTTVPLWASTLSGGSIGLISGMIGIGGGILLSPLVLLFKWATIKETAALSALFIFVNSVSGLLATMQKSGIHLTHDLYYGIAATIVGGLGGAYLGSHTFNSKTLKYLLAIGLVIASMKLLFT